MINVILVEDHPLVREGIIAMLEKEKDIECLACYGTGEGLMHGITRYQPDVLLMDINLPDIQGTELCKRVKDIYPAIHIIALSINSHPSIIRQMMGNGAHGYILKDADRHEIIAGIQTVAKGKVFFSRSAMIAMRKPENSNLPPLTRREREVLGLIAEGLTNRQIASKLFIDVTTVDSHRKNMLAKYGVNNTSALIKLAISEHLID
jgi:DNA-binding NarL/FixJ family response regulator